MSVPPGAGRPPSQPPRPRYDPAGRAARRAALRRRRIAALAVGSFLLAVACLAIVIAVTGGGTRSGAGHGDTGASLSPSPHRCPSPTPSGLPTPTRGDPLRIFISGDSMGGELGGELVSIIHSTGSAKTVSYYRVSSGLVRIDFFDWFAYLRKYGSRYQAIVFMLGTNDAQSIAVPDGAPIKFGTARWKAAYRTRVGRAMDIMLDAGVRRVYWVGMPAMRSVNFNKDMTVINAAFRDEAEKRGPAVRYVDTMSLFSVGGAFDPRWRQNDGVHFNIRGVRRLAEYVAGLVEKDWHLETGSEVSASP